MLFCDSEGYVLSNSNMKQIASIGLTSISGGGTLGITLVFMKKREGEKNMKHEIRAWISRDIFRERRV